MRRFLFAILVFSVVFMYGIAAVGEGKLTVTQKQTIIFDGKDSGAFMARIENTGDEAIYCDYGKLVIFSDIDDILATDNYVYTSPSEVLLQPGEYTYAYSFLWNNALKNAKIGDVKFSIGSDSRGYQFDKIDCTSRMGSNPNSGSNYIYVTFTNESEEILEEFYIVAAITDFENNLIFIDRNSYENIQVHPHSTITVRMYIDSDFVNYYAAHDIVPAATDAVVYVNRRR